MKEEELSQLITDMFSLLRDVRARLHMDSAKTSLLDSGIDKLERHFKEVVEISALMQQTKDILRDLARRSNEQITHMTAVEDRVTAVESTLKLVASQVLTFGDSIRLMNTTLKTMLPETPKL